MASYKQRKITRIVREFSKNGDSYDITGINLGLAKYFYREPQELFQNLTVGDYRIDQSNGRQTLIITNQTLLGKLESIQIGYVLDFGASKYETEWNVDINTLKDKYNQLVETCDNLWEYIRQTGFISDDTTMDLILPQLNVNEVWVWTEKGYMGMPIDDIQGAIKDAIQNYLTTVVYPAIDDYIERVIKPRIDLYVENTSKPSIDAFTEVQKTELKDLKDILATQLQELVDNALADRGVIPNNTDWHNLNYGTWYVADLNGSGYINQPKLDNDEGMGVVIVTDSQGGRSKVVRYYSIKKRMHFTIKTINGVWSEWGALSEGNGVRYEYTQPNHGFLFTPVMLDGTTNTWVKATKEYGADGIAVYIDANRFELVLNGAVRIPSSAKDSKNENFVADEFYFLSDTVSGGLDREKPQQIFQSLMRTYIDEQGRIWAEVEVDTPVNLEPRVLIDDVNSLDIMTSNRVVLRENTIADLMGSRRYKIGDVVEVLGYYSAGDGANHKRIISNIDDGSGVQLINGLWANLVHGNTVYSSHFGVKADGAYDNSSILQKMLDYAQKQAPNVILDIEIDNKEGVILCTKPLNMTCNGWTGKLSMSGSCFYGSHLYFKNDTQQPVCIYTREVKNPDGYVYDRFGSRLYSNGNFTISNLRIRVNHTKNLSGVRYAINSDFIDGIDVSSSCYVNVKNNAVIGVQGIGVNVAKWDVFVEYNKIDLCGIGIAVGKRTTVNTDSDFATNNLVISKNNINECRNHIYSYNNTYLKIVDNTLDVSASASIVCTNGTNELFIEKNYIERANQDNLSEEIRFFDWDNTQKPQQITAKIIVNQPSNYGDNTNVIIRDNQVPNNTSNKQHSILAINGIKSLTYKNNGKRGYEINDIQFFGVGCWFNQYGTVSDNLDIEILPPIQNNAINYNLFGSNYYKALPNAKIKVGMKNYLFKRVPFLITDNNKFDNLLVDKTQDKDNKKFRLNGTCTFTKDYTASLYNKPYTLKFYAEQADISQYVGDIKVKVYLDDVLKYEEKVLTLVADERKISWLPTLWLGTDYNVLKIELISSINCTFTNFCITDSYNSPVFVGIEKQTLVATYRALDTPYYTDKMKSEGVYGDFVSFLDENYIYEKQKEEKEKAMRLSYEEALKENPNLTYEEFVSTRPTTFSRRKRSLEIQEPVPSQALLEFKERYLG